MSEATRIRETADAYVAVGATVSAYEVWQLPDGRAAYLNIAAAISSGTQTSSFKTDGVISLDKTTGVVLLAGQRVYWDHSANQVTYQAVNDRDFLIGTMVRDATSSDLKAEVAINVYTPFAIDAIHGPAGSTTAGTVAAGGFDRARAIGGTEKLLLSATSEAQKVDLLSVDGRAPGAKGIVEAVFRVVSDGAGTVVDFNIGVANGTNATDFDSITEYCAIHLDANNVNILAQSKDSGTTVAATDTTIDYTEGSAVANRVHVLFDLRDLTDIQIYVNGALVLGSTVFKLNAATGPLFLLAHLEKTSSTDTYEIDIDILRMWTAQQ